MDQLSFSILVMVCVITHVVRTIYEVLKHQKLLKPGKLSFAIIFTNMAILWMSWFALCSRDIYSIHYAEVYRYFGIALAVMEALAFFIALFTIKTLESYDGDLITKGIYSKIRHPMYFGFICWLTGFPIIFGAVFSFFLSLLFVLNVLLWQTLEEIELEKRFPGYLEYKKTTLF